MRIVPAALVVLFLGCGDASPCASCPALNGTFAMTYEATTIESPDCASLPAPAGPASVTITRSGAELRSTIYGVPGRGVLQASADFAITAAEVPDGGADAGGQSYVLRGYYLASTRAGADAGSGSIIGKWITHGERGAKICDAERPFTGIKQ